MSQLAHMSSSLIRLQFTAAAAAAVATPSTNAVAMVTVNRCASSSQSMALIGELLQWLPSRRARTCSHSLSSPVHQDFIYRFAAGVDAESSSAFVHASVQQSHFTAYPLSQH